MTKRCMKQLVVYLCIWWPLSALAQTTDEWLRQKQTQKKYLIQQIAALQSYGNYLAKGYDIVTTGLYTIQQITEGDFDLHLDHFLAKLKVGAGIKDYARIAAAENYVSAISKKVKLFASFYNGNGNYTKDEKTYFKQVLANLSEEISTQVCRLADAQSDNKLALSDNERIAIIDEVYEEMQDSYLFINSFVSKAKLLSVQRTRVHNDLDVTKNLNDLK